MRVDLERLLVRHCRCGARSGVVCALERRLTLDDIAVDLGLAVHDSCELIERLDPGVREAVLGADVDQLIGPVKVGDRYEVIWVVGKAVLRPRRSAGSARAATAAIEQLVAMATRPHVRWVGLPRF